MDYTVLTHNPLLSVFNRERPRTYWLHQTLFLPSGRRPYHLIVIFPHSTLRVALFQPFVTRYSLQSAPPSIRPPTNLRRLLRRF